MGKTLIEKILGAHAGCEVAPGDIVDVAIDVRAARDFGGANVVQHLRQHGLGVADPSRTIFTFDCNPGGSDQGYAANQQLCRQFAREHGIGMRDIDQGIGTHIVIEEGLVGPGSTFVSTDSHANILGAVAAFGQGMGDQDIAHAWATGKVWFKVPPTVRIVLKGQPGPHATPKDLVLALLRRFGANGLLGCAAEVSGPVAEALSLAGRVTVASMATEMGSIILLFAPDERIQTFCAAAAKRWFTVPLADPDAEYADSISVDVDGLGPLISQPGHPEDVVPVSEVAGRPVDSVFIGSCTNGRLEDLRAAARVLKGRRVAPGIVLKIVPTTRRIWERALAEGLVQELTAAGALLGNPGCAGCAAGQIGMNGPGEVSVSTGNRNFSGKQGKGEVYLASPATAAATAVAGEITTPDRIPDQPARRIFPATVAATRPSAADLPPDVSVPIGPVGTAAGGVSAAVRLTKPTRLRGRVWLVNQDNVDTDQIYHNSHLAVTDLAQMGQHALGNLRGWEDFARKVQPGDIVVAGKNFGCGSSRQQAVDCFLALGVSAIVAESFGAIYERNAINAGLPIVAADLRSAGLKDGVEITLDLVTGRIIWHGGEIQARPFSPVQMEIYQRGGLLASPARG